MAVGIKGGMSRSRGEAAEREWARDIVEESKKEGQRVRKEIKTMHNFVNYLAKNYGKKRPKDLKNLKKDGQQIFTIFSKIKARMFILLRRDLIGESRLSYLFGKTLGTEAFANMNRLKRIRASQQEIMNQLEKLVAYWESVMNTGKLPWFSRFNKKPIREPLEIIKLEDMRLLGVIDKTLKIGFKKLRIIRA